jgi:pyridoxamine 5'-phosphate oxidase
MVLLRRCRARRLRLFSPTSTAAKGQELIANPSARWRFHWKSLRRQVRAEGPVEMIGDAEADSYFASRSRDSRIGAWLRTSRGRSRAATASSRGRRIHGASRARTCPGRALVGFPSDPRPHRVLERRPHRLHERRLFTRDGGGWSEGLLYP